MVAATWANILVLLKIALIENRLATRALDPHTFRNAAAVRWVCVLNFWGKKFFEPTHRWFLCNVLGIQRYTDAMEKFSHAGNFITLRCSLKQLDEPRPNHNSI